MRRLVLAACLLPLTALLVPSALGSDAGTITSGEALSGASAAPCSYGGRWSLRYTRINGRATSGTWTVTTSAGCNLAQTVLSVTGRLVHNGRQVRGFTPGRECRSSRVPSCRQVSGRGSLSVPRGIAGTWLLRLTMLVKGADAVRLSQYDGCVRSPGALTARCSFDAPPVRIR